MDIIIGLLMGCGISTVVGTGLYRSALAKQRASQEARLEQLRLELNRAHESELKQTIASLKTEYLQQSEEKESQLKQDYQHQLAEAIAAREEAEKALSDRAEEAEPTLPHPEEEGDGESEALKAEPPARETPSEPPAIAKTPIPETLPPEPPAIAKTPIPETLPPEPPAIPETPPSPSPVIEPHPPLKTGEVSDLVQLLNNTYNPDPIVRREAALAIGNIVAEQKVRTEIARIIPILGQLSRDAEPSVRLAAVTALAQINDREVIPYLQRALKDTDSEAIAAASEALAKFKRHVPKPPKAMPKNAAAQREIE